MEMKITLVEPCGRDRPPTCGLPTLSQMLQLTTDDVRDAARTANREQEALRQKKTVVVVINDLQNRAYQSVQQNK